MRRNLILKFLAILYLAGCKANNDPLVAEGSRLYTANDLPIMTCLFHAKAAGQPINDAVRYVGEGSVTIRRIQRDCHEPDLIDSKD